MQGKKTSHTMLGILLLCFPFTLFAQTQISFIDAVNYALQTNPRIMASHAQIEAARAGVEERKGNIFPKINLEIDAARSNNPLNVFSYKLSQGNVKFSDFGLSELAANPSPNSYVQALDSPGYYNNFNTALILNFPIFTGGYNLASIEKSRNLLSQAQHGNDAARNELIYDVLQAYEGVLISQELVNIAKESVEAAENYLKLTQDLRARSVVVESDVLIAQANLRATEMSVISTEAELHNQLDTFRLLIGQPDSDLIPKAHVELPPIPGTLAGLETQVVLNNPQLLSLKSRVNANRAEIDAANAAYWPKLGLQLRQDWNDENFGLSAPSGTVFLGFDWELFSLGTRSGSTKQARAEYNYAAADFDSKSINLRIALAQAVRISQTAEDQIHTSTQNKEATQEAVKILKERYGRGIITLPQLLDSQSRLDTFKAQEVMAGYDRNLARARILNFINQVNVESIH